MTKFIASLFSCMVKLLYICADFASVAFYPLSKLFSKNKIRILCYHRVCDLPKTKDLMLTYNVTPTVFDQQMAFLSQNGFNVITLEQLVDYKHEKKGHPTKTVVITFDDGYRDNYINAFPVLQKYNFKATFFVVTDYINSDRIFQWLDLGNESLSHCQKNKQYWLPLTKDHILNMDADGACFGSHTKTHRNLNNANKRMVLEELRDSKQCLEKILLKPIRCFSYPYGAVNKLTKNWVSETGYSCAVTVKAGGNTLNSDFLELRRTSIQGQDSCAKFRRKVEGAYDWFEYLLETLGFVKRIVLRKAGRE